MSAHLPPVRIDFAANAARALADPALQEALSRCLSAFRRQRQEVVEEVADWEILRQRAHQIKLHTLAHLDTYLEQLEAQVTAAGGVVHRARDGREAARAIAALVVRATGRTVVKSKSMTAEEIDLNAALEAAGCEVLETDLGEYVQRLAGEPPSHIIVPAVHRARSAIARLLAERIPLTPEADAEQITRAVRQHLRQRFLSAQVGISGVNFAVAETGTIVLVENEGNARMVTTLPRVHIALMGMDKVIPRLADLAVFLTLLPRSATGQRATSYVSLITGPRRPGEVDGPEELHLVIMDNGRSRIQADQEVRESLACIRCGACLNVCPVFARTGGHAYASPYSGPMGAVLTPLLRGLEVAGDLPFASSLCGACAEVCPVKIDLPRLLLTLRARVVARRGAPLLERLFVRVWTWTMAQPARLAAAGPLARLVYRLIVGRRLPLPSLLSAWTATRDLPVPPAAAFRQRWRG